MEDPLKAILVIITAIVIVFGILLPVELSDAPRDLKPGDEIFVLTGQTVLEDGKVCQQYYHAQISPTSPENKQTWHRLSTLLFPTHRMLSVIFDTGKIQWINDSLVVKAEYAKLVCSKPVPYE